MKQNDNRRTITFFAAVQFLYYIAIGLWSYVNVYFRELGFTGQQVGYLSVGGTVLAAVLLPVMGLLGDRLRSPKLVFCCAIGVLVPLFSLMPVVGHLWGAAMVPFFILAAILSLFTQVSGAMLEAWNGSEMERLGMKYSSIRWFGSLGFVVLMLTSSVVMGKILPVWSGCIIMSVAGAVLLVLIGRTGFRNEVSVQKEKAPSSKGLLKLVLHNYYFLSYLLLNLAICCFIGIVNLCLSYLMDYAGADPSSLGAVSGVRATAEIVAMFWIGRCKKLPPYWVLLTAASLLIAAEHLLYPWMTSFGLMVGISLLSGIGGGLYYGIHASYVLQIVDHRAASTAMSVLGVVKACVAIAGAAVGGTVIDRWGVTTLTTVVGIIMLVLTALFIGTNILGRYVWKKPYVNEKEGAAV